MNNFCEHCGAPLKEGDAFCEQCGQKIEDTAIAEQPAPQAAPQAYAGGVPAAVPAVRKSKKTLVILLACAAIVIAAALVVLLVPGILRPAAEAPVMAETVLKPLSGDLAYQEGEVKVQCTYDAPDEIIPAIYRSMDHIVFMKCWSDNGDTDLMVTVEIPGFTQKYEQKVSVTRMETQLKIHPPIAEGAVKTLNSSKNTQLVVSVKDINSGKVIVQDSKEIKLYSRYDMLWQDKDGTAYYENFLAWLTPEAPEVKAMVRYSADALNELFGYSAIVGYQPLGNLNHTQGTATQAAAMMYAMAQYYQVKYVATPFSATDTQLQRCATPAEVLNNRAGICCETAVTLASALQATGMHAVLILLPGHMQTAVEDWPGTGDYVLIETTALESAAAKDWNNVIGIYSKKEWSDYLEQNKCTVLDCDLAQTLKIQSID